MANECARCVNTDVSPTIRIGKDGLCQVCAAYERHFDARRLLGERRALLSQRFLPLKRGGAQRAEGFGPGTPPTPLFSRGGTTFYDIMVGLSGGKDSTAMLWTLKEMGFTPLAFTFDTGYYPKHIFTRAKRVAARLGIDHVVIDIRAYARKVDRASFVKTAALYDAAEFPRSRKFGRTFREQYLLNRAHYSAKCGHAMAFVRSCQLCRRLVIRAYYAEAVKRGIPLVALGINEWAALSSTASGRPTFSAFRTLKPFARRPAVTVVHVPFLLQRKRRDTFRILKRIGWKVPPGEDAIESNANSCLFARAAESTARRMLGFHPDATRLSREVTVGFITKEEAKRALAKRHRPLRTVRETLRRAGFPV